MSYKSDLYQTVYEFDLTSPSNTGKYSNGDVTIDGKTWHVENAAAASTLGITNLTGLQVTDNTTSTNYSLNVRTCPLISAPIPNLFPNYDIRKHKLRVWVYATDTGPARASDQLMVGLEKTQNGGVHAMFMSRYWNGSAISTSNTSWNPTTYQQFLDTGSPTDNVFVLEYMDSGTTNFFSGTWSAGWPAVSALRTRGVTRTVAPQSSAAAYTNMIHSSADLSVAIGVWSINTTGGMGITAKQIKLEAR